MPEPQEYYDTLEIDQGASQDDIKQAYRDLAQVWHPDRFANSPRLLLKAQEKMKSINEAYDFLKEYKPPQTVSAARTYSTPAPHSEPPISRADRNSGDPDELWRLNGHTALVSSLAFAPGGRLLISGSYDKTVRVWQLGTGLEKQWFLGHKGAVTGVAFSPDGRCALSGGMDKSVFLRDCDTRREIQYFYAGAVVESVALSPDGRYMLSGTVGAGAQLWEVSSGRELRRFILGEFVSTVCFSHRGHLVAVGTSDGDVRIYDRMNGTPLASIQVKRNSEGQMVNAVRFTRDGAYLLTASQSMLQLWQTSSGREAMRIETGVTGVTSADMSQDGRLLLTGHSDCTVRLWSVESQAESHVFKGHTEAIKAVALSSDGTTAASGGFDRSIRVWRVTA